MTPDEIMELANSCAGWHWMDEAHIQRFAALVVAAEREAIIALIEAYKVPVGNSAAGEMAAEWTMDALRDLRDAIRARGEK
jgi:hypothetical protein